MTAPATINGLRTRTRSEANPITSIVIAAVIQYQFATAFARDAG